MLLQRMFRCFADIAVEESSSPAAQDLVVSSPSSIKTAYVSRPPLAEIPEYSLIRPSSQSHHVPEDSSIGSHELPEDLLIDILLCVPAEFVTKFRSLSKFYQELIDSPDFRQKHAHLSLKRQACSSHVILETTWRYDIIDHQVLKLDSAKSDAKFKRLIDSVSKDKGNYRYSILGCCLGILCLSRPPKPQQDYGHILLWNPLTGSGSPRIAVGNWDSSKCYFGHDASTDDFKILKLRQVYMNYDFEIYSSKLGSWRKIVSEYKNLPKVLDGLSSGTFVEGTNSVHILVGKVNVQGHITAFDFSSEKFKTIPLPWKQYQHAVGLSSLDGCLCVYTEWGPSKRLVWVMKEYGVEKSWTCLCCLPNDDVLGNRYLSPLKFARDGRQLLVLSMQMLFELKYGVRAFNLEKKSTSSLLDESERKLTTKLNQFLYAPSLREFS